MQGDASLPPSRPEPSYLIVGAGKDAFSRTDIRDMIRRGEVNAQTELARQGTEEYLPASSFPELGRYFALAAPPPSATKAPSGPRPSTITRMGPGLIYPFTGVGWAVLIGAMLLPTLPLGTIVAWMFTSVYGLAVIRRSAEGSTAMPHLADVGNIPAFLMALLKLLVVTLVSAWTLILAIPLTFMLRSMMIPFVALLVMVLYYPAAVATLAKWNTISHALSVSQIFRFMSILGADYVLALIALLFASLLVAVASLAAGKFLGPHGREVISGLFSTWTGFYFFHLLGWGMYRHEEEF